MFDEFLISSRAIDYGMYHDEVMRPQIQEIEAMAVTVHELLQCNYWQQQLQLATPEGQCSRTARRNLRQLRRIMLDKFYPDFYEDTVFLYEIPYNV